MRAWKIFTNKRANSLVEYVFSTPVRALFVVIAFVIFLLVVIHITNNKVETHDLEMNALFNRIYFSPNAISYLDPETRRAYPGIIDLEKLNTANLGFAINFNEGVQSENAYSAMAARVFVCDLDGNFPGKPYTVVDSPGGMKKHYLECPAEATEKSGAFVNEQGFKMMWPKRRLTGSGGVYWLEKSIPVTYYDAGEFKAGVLIVQITKER